MFGNSSEGLINHSSFLKDKIGEQIFDRRITIEDQSANPKHFLSRKFDSEGMASPNVKFIENGVLKDYAYNLRNGLKLGVVSNGKNAAGFQGEMPMFLSLQIEPGSKSQDQLIESIDNGILITNIFYANFVNPPAGICTGLTRDGLFRIKNGETVSSLKNKRWTDSIMSMFENTEPGNDVQQIAGFFLGSTITPSIKIGQFNFSSKGKH